MANVALISVSMVAGFGPVIRHHVQTHAPSYPLMVHVHAIAFSAWLVLLATQILLIGAHRLDIHRRLGVAGAGLAAVMVVLAACIFGSQMMGVWLYQAPSWKPLAVRLLGG